MADKNNDIQSTIVVIVIVLVWLVRRFVDGRVKWFLNEWVVVAVVQHDPEESGSAIPNKLKVVEAYREIVEKQRDGFYDHSRQFTGDLLWEVGWTVIDDILIVAEMHMCTAARHAVDSKGYQQNIDRAVDLTAKASRLAKQVHHAFGGKV